MVTDIEIDAEIECGIGSGTASGVRDKSSDGNSIASNCLVCVSSYALKVVLKPFNFLQGFIKLLLQGFKGRRAHKKFSGLSANVEWWHRRGKRRIQPLTLSPVATHGWFAGLFVSWSRVESVAMQTYTTRILWHRIVWGVNAVALKLWLMMKKRPLLLWQFGKVAVEDGHHGPILSQQWTQVVDG